MDGREQNRAGQELEGVWQQRAQDAWSLATGWRRGIQLCLESVVFKRSTMMWNAPVSMQVDAGGHQPLLFSAGPHSAFAH